MLPVALAALIIGCAAGVVMARRFVLRLLVAAVCALVALFIYVLGAAPDALPGDGHTITIVALLMAPPMAAGLMGGAILAWLFRHRAKPT